MTTTRDGVGPSRRAAGLAAVAAATLLSEVTWTRLLSVSHIHVFAFLAVSTALLGGAVSARWVAERTIAAGSASDRRASRAAAAFAALIPLAHLGVQAIGFDPFELRTQARAWVELAGVYLLLALPFAASGVAVAEVLAQAQARAPRLYAADLAGAAVGSLSALVLIPGLHGTGALWVASAVALTGSAFFAVGRGWLIALGAPGVLAASFLAPLPLKIAPSKTTSRGEPFAEVLRDPARHRGTSWTAHARVDHIRFSARVERLVLDAGVAAVRVPPANFGWPSSDATLAYELRSHARVLVIGSGAGWELGEARTFGARKAVGVEVNRAVLAATPAFIAEDSGVELIRDDARSYLELNGPPFDVVVMIHTISNAATAAGALGLTEDHLLTVEAFERIIERLSPNGLLFVTRPEAQLPRLLTTLRAASSEPLRSRTAVWREPRGGFYGAVLFGRMPLTGTATSAIARRVRQRNLVLEYLPGTPSPPAGLNASIILEEPIEPLEAQSGLRLTPATDDAPFFHRRLPFGQLPGPTGVLGGPPRLALEDRPLAELALLALLLESLLISLLILWTPRGVRAVPRSARLRVTIGFSALGAAFMILEIALVQRLGLLLGAPTRAIAVSFAGLLLGAGLGSRLSGGASPFGRGLIASVAALVFAFGGGPFVDLLISADVAVRMALAAVFAFGVGTALGGVFPAALARRPPSGAAYAFSVNAVASMGGTGIALLLAPEVGLGGLGLLAALLYLVSAGTLHSGQDQED